MGSWLKVEFHCHTYYSIDSLNKIPQLLQTARKRGIDRLVITDHNTIRGAQEAQKLDPELVIIGEEIQTKQGELLAAYVKEEIPSNLPVFETIRILRDQDAFISVSHPMDRYRGWSLPDLIDIVQLVDAVETFNARCIFPYDNTQAERFALKYGLDATVGSDAHVLSEVGQAVLVMPSFTNSAELKLSIRQGEAITRLTGGYIHLTATYAKLLKRIAKFGKREL